MKKTENISVSLQLVKDETTQELCLNIEFDQEASNFFRDKNSISWCPTIEELDFISEAFQMITNAKHQRNNRQVDTEHRDPTSHAVTREADEKVILDRVLEKKRTNY